MNKILNFLVQLLHILMPSFRWGFLILGSKIHFRYVHPRLNPFSSEFIFSLHISTGSCLRVTVAFVCKLSQQFEFAANSADKNPDRLVRIVKSWTGYERAISQSDSRI